MHVLAKRADWPHAAPKAGHQEYSIRYILLHEEEDDEDSFSSPIDAFPEMYARIGHGIARMEDLQYINLASTYISKDVRHSRLLSASFLYAHLYL